MDTHVLVYGAYGHTGRFVVAELLRRGMVPVLSGRNPDALDALGAGFPDLEVRPASVVDSPSLDHAVRDVAAVVNCAGPFLDTCLPVAAASVRAGVHYLDVSAEQAAVQSLYGVDWGTDVVVLPAMAFYGGLPDLLATALADTWDLIDEITVAVGLDHWWPTPGTRNTGRRNTTPRVVVVDSNLVPAPQPVPARDWSFPEPIGRQPVLASPMTEMITMGRHLKASRVKTYLSANALADIRNPATRGPLAADESGRSAQLFVVDVVARLGASERRITAHGRDIYAVTAPLIVEAVRRLLDGRTKVSGAAAPGEIFDANDFLKALGRSSLTILRN